MPWSWGSDPTCGEAAAEKAFGVPSALLFIYGMLHRTEDLAMSMTRSHRLGLIVATQTAGPGHFQLRDPGPAVECTGLYNLLRTALEGGPESDLRTSPPDPAG